MKPLIRLAVAALALILGASGGLATSYFLRPSDAEIRGALPEPEVSQLLSRSSFALSAQDELSVTKSGTFVAYAAHALNIISPHAGRAAAAPLCWTSHPSELLEGVSPAELATRAEKLRDWHERTCSWPRIAEEFARALQLPVAKAVNAASTALP